MRAHFARWAFQGSNTFAPLCPLLLALVACGGRAHETSKRGTPSGTDSTGGTAGAGTTGGTGGEGTTGGTGQRGGGKGGSNIGGTGGTATAAGGKVGQSAAAGSSAATDDAGASGAANCPIVSCAKLGVQCGKVVDSCGNVIDCALEGLSCGAGEFCTGSADTPARCMPTGACELCHAVRDCSTATQETTLTGRVVTPGRSDDNAGNQLGVPNALVYILRSNSAADLPGLATGIGSSGSRCNRCEDNDPGPVLISTITDATGAFTLAHNVPVGEAFTLVIQAGRFRRAVLYEVPSESACQTTALPTTLPENPTRLPRDAADGLAVHLPHIAVSTGQNDALECVLEKLGISHNEFGDPGITGDNPAHVHLYRGGSATAPSGARIDDTTPHATELYSDAARLAAYDLVLADCEGASSDSTFAERDAYGANVRDYVNRGGRLLASHLSFTWLDGNGSAPYDPVNPATTGLSDAAIWNLTTDGTSTTGTGVVAMGRPQASPHIADFAAFLASEMVAMPPGYDFDLLEPRSQTVALGLSSEEFVFTSSVTRSMGSTMSVTSSDDRTQLFAFDTPYAAPADAACGRVAYSGFHVTGDLSGGASTPFGDAVFPQHCTGDLTLQERVLAYMLFDLGACTGSIPASRSCTPTTCESLGLTCGFADDGCGGRLECGPCPLPQQ